eukprot:3049867-Rhodomonas_salina.1
MSEQTPCPRPRPSDSVGTDAGGSWSDGSAPTPRRRGRDDQSKLNVQRGFWCAISKCTSTPRSTSTHVRPSSTCGPTRQRHALGSDRRARTAEG